MPRQTILITLLTTVCEWQQQITSPLRVNLRNSLPNMNLLTFAILQQKLNWQTRRQPKKRRDNHKPPNLELERHTLGASHRFTLTPHTLQSNNMLIVLSPEMMNRGMHISWLYPRELVLVGAFLKYDRTRFTKPTEWTQLNTYS